MEFLFDCVQTVAQKHQCRIGYKWNVSPILLATIIRGALNICSEKSCNKSLSPSIRGTTTKRRNNMKM